jgi:dephospho-CoA kinase
MIVGLCGFAGSGKGAVADFLRSKGWSHYSIRDILREELARHQMPVNRDNMIMIANSLRSQFGNDVLVQRVLSKMPPNANAVMESLRNPDEVGALRKHGGFVLMAMDAAVHLRLQRLVAGGRPGDPKTLEDLRRLDNQETDANSSGIRIRECMAMADYTIQNDGDLAQLYSKVDEILSKL